jgi:hypothetical protein
MSTRRAASEAKSFGREMFIAGTFNSEDSGQGIRFVGKG